MYYNGMYYLDRSGNGKTFEMVQIHDVQTS